MKNKKILILICTITIIFGAYFFIFSPQAMKSLSVDGTSVPTLRAYQAMKYPFSIKEELKTENDKKDGKKYTMTHLEYPSFLVSIDDFQDYVRKLQEDGFLVITAVNPSLLEDKGCFYELALPLKGKGYSILVSLDYNYARKVPTISYVKLPGEASEKDK